LAAVAVVALVTPAMATYTECTVTKEISFASRPAGPRHLASRAKKLTSALCIERRLFKPRQI
jgi:hypothetical protein